jgi:BirA family biotin operon repressor/biotin-[acetyl-CoA-carboxylase] ligase
VDAAALISRRERFSVVGSTNDVVAGWLADGVPEVCVAVADEQSAGRGREMRTWTAPPGAALLMSLGFRPRWLPPEHVWRLAAVVSVAMAETAEAVAGLADDTIRLKWPNDLVEASGEWLAGASPSPSESSSQSRVPIRKLAGVLGETTGLGTDDPRAIVGIGINVDWERDSFPPGIASGMTSLRDLAGRPVNREELLDVFLGEVLGRIVDLRRGLFDAEPWQRRQLTNGALVRLDPADGRSEVVTARGVDPETGGLVIEAGGIERTVMSGEIHHLRLAEQPSASTVASPSTVRV